MIILYAFLYMCNIITQYEWINACGLWMSQHKQQEREQQLYYMWYRHKRNDFPLSFKLIERQKPHGNDFFLKTNIHSCIKFAASVYNDTMKFKFFNTKHILHITYEMADLPLFESNTVYICMDEYDHRPGHTKFDGPGNVLAHASMPAHEKYLCIDSSENWTRKSLKYTLIHELGHLLGLRHNPNQRSIMYANVVQQKPMLYTEDIQTLNTLYPFIGSSNNNTPSPASV